MARVISDMSVSLDGYVTGPNDSRGEPVRRRRRDAAWGEAGPIGDTLCFVVTHNRPARSYSPVFTFVTDGVLSVIEQAKKVRRRDTHRLPLLRLTPAR